MNYFASKYFQEVTLEQKTEMEIGDILIISSASVQHIGVNLRFRVDTYILSISRFEVLNTWAHSITHTKNIMSTLNVKVVVSIRTSYESPIHRCHY